MTRYLNLTILLLLSYFSIDAQPIIRYPAISPDGQSIAFSFQGDIWVAKSDGSAPQRLTIHEAYEYEPHWSPDGMSIVFIGNRFGNDDLFTVDREGKSVKRLTYHSAADREPCWGSDGQIYFTTNRDFTSVEREYEIHTIPAQGGTPGRLLDALGYNPVLSPDGKMIAFERGSCRISREDYRGPANRDIWIYHIPSKTYHQITSFDGQDIEPAWGKDNQLYWLSAQDGRYNLFAAPINPDASAGKPRQVTNFKGTGVRYFDVGMSDVAVIEKGNEILRLDIKQGKSSPIKLSLTGDDRFDPVVDKTFTNGADEYAVSPNGKMIAMTIHGDIFIKAVDKDIDRTTQLTNHPFRDRNPVWVSDSVLLFVSDRDGNYEVYSAKSSDPKQANPFLTLKFSVKRITRTPEDETELILSPDHSKVSIIQGRGKLVVMDVDSTGLLNNPVVMQDGWDTPGGVAWSPDSRWLAYALSDLDFNSEVYIQPIDNHVKPVNVTMHPRDDSQPFWSPDGSKLGFMSIRNNGDNDVWFAWLKKEDWEKSKPDWEGDKETELFSDKKDGKKEDKKGSDSLEIDLDAIYERLVQVTHFPGNEGDLSISKDGETFFFTTFNGGRAGSEGDPEFKSIKWDGSELKTVLSNGRIWATQLGPKDDYLYYFATPGVINRLKLPDGKPERLPFIAKMRIDQVAEREQVFEEAWKTIEEGFYDPKFHGYDWTALKNKYKPWALAASTKQDFIYLFNELLGQLNSSHMGLFGSTPEETQRETTGKLGAEVKPVSQGVEVVHIVPNTPAANEGALQVGDIITAVNDQAVTGSGNFYQLLANTANQRTLLSIRAKDGSTREVVLRPSVSINGDLYDEWVQQRKDLTTKYSNGRLGYIHIQGMNWPSFERFERELMASGSGKEGVVIDVRYNGGGWTTDMLMAVLNVRQHAYTIPRGAADDLKKENTRFKDHYPFGERLPLSAWTKPSIAMCNESSYSNAEIFSHAYKTLGIGKLVGKATFGAVISTGGYGLMDGSFVRLPFRAWYVKATGKNMEHGPAVPDIQVENDPEYKVGDDQQLKAAVDVLLREVNSKN